MRYQIISTLGPATSQPHHWHALVAAGATRFRLNTSHMSVEQCVHWLKQLAQYCPQMPVVLDLQGSKWRLGQFTAINLEAGTTIELVLAERTAQGGTLPVPHADFFRAAGNSNGEIVLNDARQRLKVLKAGPDCLQAQVVLGGEISAHKGITLAETAFRSEGLSHKDRAIFELGRLHPHVCFAISYVKDAIEMRRYRQEMPAVPLIAKLERAGAVADVAMIATQADELWVCRGDLGAELGLRGMAQAVAGLRDQVQALGVPVLMAGQVLEHMCASAVPTRAEVCNLYDVLVSGYSGVVLSDETAVGRYPLQAVQTAALFVAG